MSPLGHPDESDRIVEHDTRYEEADGVWWQVSSSATYPTADSGAALTTSVSRIRLTGLTTNLTAETVYLDMFGNATTNRRSVNRDAKMVTETTIYPDSSVAAENVTSNGLLVSSVSKTALTNLFLYDALERQTGITDPRTSASITHYNEKGQVDYVEDAATNRTSFVYDPDTGRQIAVSNALGLVTRSAYTTKGQLEKTWGDTAYPVSYAFDAYGRMTNMATYRGGSDWDGEDWPASPGTADATVWLYDEASGLLTNKVYADGQGPAYSYSADGRLSMRTWARGDTTTYSYDPNTGEMTNIAYSGTATTNVTFTYTRAGLQSGITDAVGGRTFLYNGYLQLTNETITGAVSGVVSRSYSASGMKGRSAGVGLDVGSYSVEYGYESVGRLNAISWTNAGMPVKRTVQYAYLPDSALLFERSVPSVGLTNTWFYEDNRDMITVVSNRAFAKMVSRYEYTNDALGRRIYRHESGAAFNTYNREKRYSYNDRSELTNSTKNYVVAGGTTNNFGAYAYDNIGNRETATTGTTTWTYLANGLNQYTNIHAGVTNSPLYDLDGNLTNDGTWAYAWDAENRLMGVEPLVPTNNGRYKLAFMYDYMNRRAQRVIWEYSGGWTNPETNIYIYDGWNLLAERYGKSATCYTNFYVWGLDLSQSLQGAGGIGGLVATAQGGMDGWWCELFYCYDANGNVDQLLHTNGWSGLPSRYEYDPYGNLVICADPATTWKNPFRFSTKYIDCPWISYSWKYPCLYYYGRRFYSPELGRWLSRDPIEEEGGPLFAFVGNSPINGVDPFGFADLLKKGIVFKYMNSSGKIVDLTAATAAEDIRIDYDRTTHGGSAGFEYGSSTYTSGAEKEACEVTVLLKIHLYTEYKNRGEVYKYPAKGSRVYIRNHVFFAPDKTGKMTETPGAGGDIYIKNWNDPSQPNLFDLLALLSRLHERGHAKGMIDLVNDHDLGKKIEENINWSKFIPLAKAGDHVKAGKLFEAAYYAVIVKDDVALVHEKAADGAVMDFFLSKKKDWKQSKPDKAGYDIQWTFTP